MMCGENRHYIFILFVGLLLACAGGALRAEEQGPWYLISEAELRSIEAYRKKSEAERRGLLLQASELRTRAVRLNERAANSSRESENLNRLLREAREENKKLTLSYNEYETGASRTISSLNTAIGELKAENKTLAGQRDTLFAIVITAGAAILLLVFFNGLRWFKILPF